jgi:peptidyl-prolyl cis-trans isomerase B (cyclophilin B)
MSSRLLVSAFVVLLTAGCANTVTGKPVAGPAPSTGTTTATSKAAPTSGTTTPGSAPSTCTFSPAADGGQVTEVAPPAGTDVATSGAPTITFSTDKGPLKIELDPAAGPCSVHNFRHLVAKKFYDGTKCHRVTTAGILVLQCGDPSFSGAGTPGYEFDDKMPAAGVYQRGVVAMANAGPGTNGCQFFIVYGQSEIAPNYPVLGKVVSGMEIVDKVAAAGVQGGGDDGEPKEPLELTTATEG